MYPAVYWQPWCVQCIKALGWDEDGLGSGVEDLAAYYSVSCLVGRLGEPTIDLTQMDSYRALDEVRGKVPLIPIRVANMQSLLVSSDIVYRSGESSSVSSEVLVDCAALFAIFASCTVERDPFDCDFHHLYHLQTAITDHCHLAIRWKQTRQRLQTCTSSPRSKGFQPTSIGPPKFSAHQNSINLTSPRSSPRPQTHPRLSLPTIAAWQQQSFEIELQRPPRWTVKSQLTKTSSGSSFSSPKIKHSKRATSRPCSPPSISTTSNNPSTTQTTRQCSSTYRKNNPSQQPSISTNYGDKYSAKLNKLQIRSRPSPQLNPTPPSSKTYSFQHHLASALHKRATPATLPAGASPPSNSWTALAPHLSSHLTSLLLHPPTSPLAVL